MEKRFIIAAKTNKGNEVTYEIDKQSGVPIWFNSKNPMLFSADDMKSEIKYIKKCFGNKRGDCYDERIDSNKIYVYRIDIVETLVIDIQENQKKEKNQKIKEKFQNLSKEEIDFIKENF